MLYDAFISYATEDKETFVKPLALALKKSNVAVWFDEFELKVGDSLRRSIDLGLSKSRFGIVILSRAFFGKKWPEWELDGLVQRQISNSTPVILPIRLNITQEYILNISPSIADIYALRAEVGLDQVVTELLRVIKPQGSSLVVARERLIQLNYYPPVVTDDWWHNAIEYCGSNSVEGTFQDAMGWGRWGFPLPPRGETAIEKGERIAWAALQLNWQAMSENERISQVSHPDIVHNFIKNTPGLMEVSNKYLPFLVSYAPQITIKGYGGDFEILFAEWLEHSYQVYAEKQRIKSTEGTGVTINKTLPTCDELIALHDNKFGGYKPETIACNFVQGDLMGPPVKVYENIDYIFWLLSKESSWMPEPVRVYLIEGMKRWAVWPWFSFSDDHKGKDGVTGKLVESLQKYKRGEKFKLNKISRLDLETRAEHSIALLGINEKASELCDKFINIGFIDAWIEERLLNRKKRV